MTESTYWEVAVNAPIKEALTYHSQLNIEPGHKVVVPLGNRQVTGVVLRQVSAPNTESGFKLKAISEIVMEYKPLPKMYVDFGLWLSQYYLHPVGLTFAGFFPPLPIQTKPRKSKRPPVIAEQAPSKKPTLTAEQLHCIESIDAQKGFGVHLIFGVTGSGKTEIYLHLLEKVLAEGKKGLVLVPEISLTPQLVNRFAARFGDQISVIHSQLTEREKTNQWWDIVDQRKNILIGARSALFCPIENLGMIIVDEEHEASFKQDEKLKYNGRDSAIVLAKQMNCPILLGSATPSLESWKNAQEKKYFLHELQQRVEDRPMPTVQIVPLKKETDTDRTDWVKPFWMSDELLASMKNHLDNNQQVALFLNRRGMSQMVLCPDCGHIVKCPNCEISLTLHARNHLICHYCDYHENLKVKCPECIEGELKPVGLGTEQVETDLQKLFPDKKIARADRDEIQNRADLELLIQEMEENKIQILVGTQMIAKGLDFPHLKLVGLLLADIGFNLPDFRASEKAFQLMTQMSGRSGRHVKENESAGEVIIQAFNTEHVSLKFALTHNYAGFAEEELRHREALQYPPYGKLTSVRIQGPDERQTRQFSEDLLNRALKLQQQFERYKDLEILGPAPAPIAKLRNQYRFHLLLKGPKSGSMTLFCQHLFRTEDWIPNKIKVLLDVDPLSLL